MWMSFIIGFVVMFVMRWYFTKNYKLVQKQKKELGIKNHS